MRRRRHLIEDAEYHVIARANRQEYILSSPEIKELLIATVRRAKTKFDFTVSNFCIMSNHIHLLIRPGRGESLSSIMQWILSVFALQFNRIFGYIGHVWYDRFKSVAIVSIRQFIATFAYIADNPVRAGLVSSPYDYRYNGVCHIRDGDYRLIDYS